MSYGNEKKLNKELQIVMTRQLAEGRYHMSLGERRLVYVAMSKISAEDEEFGTVTFSRAEYIELLRSCGINIDRARFEDELKESARALLQRIVEVDHEGVWKAWQWMSKSEYDRNSGIVTVKFHDEMKPFLLFLAGNKGYTKFLLKFAMPLQSPYSVRFYEYMRGKVSEILPVTKCKLTLDEIRELMILEDKYSQYRDLKRRVIAQALKEINNKTDLNLTMREHRGRGKGSPVRSITFLIQLKLADQPQPWHRYMLYSEDDLDDEIILKIQQETGQKIGIAKSIPNSEHRKSAKARLLFELINGKHNLTQVKYAEGFVKYLIGEYSQDDVGIRQLSFADVFEDKPGELPSNKGN